MERCIGLARGGAAKRAGVEPAEVTIVARLGGSGDPGVTCELHAGGTITTSAGTPLALGPGRAAIAATFLDVDAEIIALAAPWDTPADLAPFLAEGRRRLVVSVCGEHGGAWFDGPLAHLVGGGVASYLPAGGPAVLRVPATLTASLKPTPLAKALAAEGGDDERAHRCLLARVVAWASQNQASGAFTVLVDGFSRADAVRLALLRQGFPVARLTAFVPPMLWPPPPPWRRFCENARIGWAEAAGAAAGETTFNVDLAALRALVPVAAAAAIGRSLNSVSDVLPKSLA